MHVGLLHVLYRSTILILTFAARNSLVCFPPCRPSDCCEQFGGLPLRNSSSNAQLPRKFAANWGG